MAKAICVHTTIESENVWVPELLPFVGKKVQLIVVEDEPATAESAVHRHPDNVTAPEDRPKRKLGSLSGLLKVPEDFDDPLPEAILRAFEGRTDE